jgi:hypothetical protein
MKEPSPFLTTDRSTPVHAEPITPPLLLLDDVCSPDDQTPVLVFSFRYQIVSNDAVPTR